MAKLEIQISASPDQCSLNLKVDGARIGGASMDAADLDQLIHKLAAARALLTDTVPLQLEPVAKVEAVRDPCWRVNQPIEGGYRPLILRHPGLGWIGYALSERSATEMVEQLTAQPKLPGREGLPTTARQSPSRQLERLRP